MALKGFQLGLVPAKGLQDNSEGSVNAWKWKNISATQQSFLKLLLYFCKIRDRFTSSHLQKLWLNLWWGVTGRQCLLCQRITKLLLFSMFWSYMEAILRRTVSLLWWNYGNCCESKLLHYSAKEQATNFQSQLLRLQVVYLIKQKKGSGPIFWMDTGVTEEL